MKKIFVLLIYLICYKQICSKTCNSFTTLRGYNSWFAECQPPCHCSPQRPNYCVKDLQRECVGCVEDMYANTGNCLCIGDLCRCSDGGRWCNKKCIGREERCDGLCGEKDWYCSSMGRCIPQTETCNGAFYLPATGCANYLWKCNGGCIPEYQACNKNCNENLGYWMCGSHCKKGEQDMWESNGMHCQRKTDTRIVNHFPECPEGEWKCKENCIPRYESCEGECNKDQGDWMCGVFCKKEIEKGEFENKGQICITKAVFASSLTNDTTTTNGTNPILVIVGVSSGGFVGVVAIIVGIFFYCRKKKKRITRRETITMNSDNQEMALGKIVDTNPPNEFAGAINEIHNENLENRTLQIPVEPTGASNAINVTGSQLSAEGNIILQSSQDTYNTNNINNNILTNNTVINVNVSREDLPQLLRSMNQTDSADPSEAEGQQNHLTML